MNSSHFDEVEQEFNGESNIQREQNDQRKHKTSTQGNSEVVETLIVPEKPDIRYSYASVGSSDVDADASIGPLALDQIRTAISRQSTVGPNRLKHCFRLPGKLRKNRVAPAETVPLTQNTRPEEENENAAFSLVNFGEFDALVELATHRPAVLHQHDQNNRSLLHHAAAKGHLIIAKFLVANHAKINDMDEQGNLPIHLAVMEGHRRMTQFLLSVGADAMFANKDGLQPIHMACEKNDVALLKILLEIPGIDVNAEAERGATPVHYCCIRDSADCLRLLLEHGANIYLRDLERTYPIHVAVANISFECVKTLFEHEERYYGTKLQRDSLTSTHLMPNTQTSRLASIASVCTTSDTQKSRNVTFEVNPSRNLSKTELKLIHLAQSLRRMSNKNLDKDLSLIDLTNCEEETPLHVAVTSGNAEMVKVCLSRNARINAKQIDENTPVHYACIKDDLECVQLLFSAQPAMQTVVLKMANKNGYTPLHLAAVYNHEKLIRYLVEKNGSPVSACSLTSGRYSLISMNDGSPLEMVDGNGWTPLLLAAMKGAFQACIQLLRLGANPNAHDMSNRNLVHLLMLFRGPGVRTVLPEVNDEDLFKRLVNEKDNFGSTPLHYSTKMGNLGATSAFVLRGASALERDNERNTPLHTAAYFGRLHTCEILLDTAHGMRAMNSPDASGRLPLHVAVQHGHVNVVKLFLEKGCVFRKCHSGNTPLHYVAIGGCVKTCRILLQTNPSLLNQINFQGMTALHYAAREDNAEVLEHLLTSKASIVPDKDGKYFVTYAIQRRNYDVMRVVITHPRWPEMHSMLENTPQCPVDGLIRDMPSMCALVLDRSIKESGMRNSMDHEITYDFTVLQRPLKLNEAVPKDPMRRMKLMVELERKELLIHPLCTAYLQRKWHTYGRWVQMCAATYYAFMLAAITILVLGHSPIRHVETWDKLKPCSDLYYRTPAELYLSTTVASFVLVMTLLDLLFKAWQLFSQRTSYFKDWNNHLSFLLNTLAMIYSAMCLAKHLDHHHIGLGVIVMFLAWFNFLLQMMRFNHVGIFVVMFLQVFATVGKCLVVFSVVFIAFALSFHVLFRIPHHRDLMYLSPEKRAEAIECFAVRGQLQSLYGYNSSDAGVAMELQPFQYLGLSMFKTLMMMLGEYEHTETVIEPLIGHSTVSLHFPEITLFFYVAFVFLVPIILMNLLIGLAVGDIEHVRQSAVLRLISQQVYWLAELEPKITFFFRNRIYNAHWRKKAKSDYKSQTKDTASGTADRGANEEVHMHSNLREAMKSLSSIEKQLTLQERRTSAIIQKLDIRLKEFTMDEGVYPGYLLGSGGIGGEFSARN